MRRLEQPLQDRETEGKKKESQEDRNEKRTSYDGTMRACEQSEIKSATQM